MKVFMCKSKKDSNVPVDAIIVAESESDATNKLKEEFRKNNITIEEDIIEVMEIQ